MNRSGVVRHTCGSLLAVDDCADHVDIYAIHVGARVQRLIARVTMEGDSFEVHADSDDEKLLLRRIESSTMAPRILEDLGSVFDSPQMFASRVHSGEHCAFRTNGEVPLSERPSQLKLV